MMRRSLADARRWMRQGTALLVREADLDDDALSAPSALPGWSRRQLIAHVAANADALGNLIHHHPRDLGRASRRTAGGKCRLHRSRRLTADAYTEHPVAP